MSLGYSAVKTDVDARAGSLAVQLRDIFLQVQRFETYLLATPDANLVALGYAQAEVNTLKSAFVDLNKLATIYQGTGTQTTVYDFTQFAKQLIGVA